MGCVVSEETRDCGTYTVKIEVSGTKPWVGGIKSGKPEYVMTNRYKVTVLDRETGQVASSGAFGTVADAFQVGDGVYRAMRAGYPVPLH